MAFGCFGGVRKGGTEQFVRSMGFRAAREIHVTIVGSIRQRAHHG